MMCKETIEDIGFGGLKLVQSEEGFRFGIDAVLLADFASGFCAGAEHVVDLGTGNGVIPLIMSHKMRGCCFTGIEEKLQPEWAGGQNSVLGMRCG